MIVLYHGTTLRLEQPLACMGREDLDFGKGYVEWASQYATGTLWRNGDLGGDMDTFPAGCPNFNRTEESKYSGRQYY